MSEHTLSEGKTKMIVAGPKPDTVYLRAKDDLTGGDAAKVAHIHSIGEQKTEQAANTFRLLAAAGVPIAFREKADARTLLCDACDMLPLEFVVRRFAWGSYLKRNPDFAPKADGKPHRFDQPVWELFHKHALVTPPHVDAPTQMDEGDARKKFLKDGQWPAGVFTDPYLQCNEDAWHIYDPKSPVTGAPLHSIAPALSKDELAHCINDIILPSFLTLEKAWQKVDTAFGPVSLVDIKFELGRRTADGTIVMADVVDNDSWRIWPGANPKQQLDKQCFRDGHALENVSENYEIVTQLTKKFGG